MKWNNKGNELDRLGNHISSFEEIYIFGAGMNGEIVFKILNIDINIKAFIDNDKNKWGTNYCGVPVIGIDQIPNKQEGYAIVIAASQRNTPIIMEQLVGKGFKLNQNMFHYWKFIQYFEIYKNNKVYLAGCTISITERCTLNCEKCSILTSYVHKPKHHELESLQADVDLFFSAIDYICLFNLLGGEPFLYPHLVDLIEYIGSNYKSKIGKITLITNGMILPKDEVIQAIKRNEVAVTVSDYRQALPQIANTVSKTIEYFKQNGIEHNIETVDQWIDFGYEYVNREGSTEKELQEVFELCNMPCRLLQDGKYYYCANSKFAINAGIIQSDIDNEFDLHTVNEANKKLLLEFEWGYNNKGYIELCKKCNGYLTMNKNYIEVARQCKRINT